MRSLASRLKPTKRVLAFSGVGLVLFVTFAMLVLAPDGFGTLIGLIVGIPREAWHTFTDGIDAAFTAAREHAR